MINKQSRGYIFGIVIQPKFSEDYISPNWNDLEDNEIIEHLELLKLDVSELNNSLTFPT